MSACRHSARSVAPRGGVIHSYGAVQGAQDVQTLGMPEANLPSIRHGGAVAGARTMHGSLCIAPPQGQCMRCPTRGAIQRRGPWAIGGSERARTHASRTLKAAFVPFHSPASRLGAPARRRRPGDGGRGTEAGGRAAARWPTRGAIQKRGTWAIGGSGRARTHASRTLKAAFVPFHSPASAFTTTRSGPRGRRGPRPTAQPSDRSHDHLRSARARERA